MWAQKCFQNMEIFKFVDLTSFSNQPDSDKDSFKIK